uniref:Insulin like growth factor binding protein 1 n=1 Tax=Buteo japonicus TaxID=224669 RepID=A0A8B9Z8Y3_9AVES
MLLPVGEFATCRVRHQRAGRERADPNSSCQSLPIYLIRCRPARATAGSWELLLLLICQASHSIEPEDLPLESTEMTQDQLLNYQLMFPIGQDKSIPWNAITTYENMKAKRISELKKWKEQCETSLDGESAGCWCVHPKNGRRIPGSPEMKGDPECQQYLSSQE